jgi:hypothetical protein
MYTLMNMYNCNIADHEVRSIQFGRKRHILQSINHVIELDDTINALNGTDNDNDNFLATTKCNSYATTESRCATTMGQQPSSSLLIQSAISQQRQSIWYLHRMIVVVMLWIMCCCSSEAFASRSNNSFFGRKLCTISFFRGGASSSGTTKSSITDTSTTSSSSSTTTVTCVMQAPPRISSTINSGFNSDNNNNNSNNNNSNNNSEKNQKNIIQPTKASMIRNGVSSSSTFYRPQRYRMDESMENDIPVVQDVITAAIYVAETKLPTDIGQFQLRAYRIPTSSSNEIYNDNININGKSSTGIQQQPQQEPCVIYSRAKPPFGNATHFAQHVPVRIHDQCLTSEVFGSQRYVF